MWLDGDVRRRQETWEKVERIRSGLSGLIDVRPGIERHAALAEHLLELGELEQGLLDAQLAREGRERWTPLSARLGKVMQAVAEAFHGSFRHRGAPPSFDGVRSKAAPLREALRILRDLRGVGVSDVLSVAVPAGFTAGGLYPETFLEAAGRLRASSETPWRGELRVVGVRGAGTTCAALVAAVGRASVMATVRPAGQPVTVNLTGRTAWRVTEGAGAEALWAVVDEGPDASGASFGAVADWLEDWGVRRESLVFFPGHSGELGPDAQERHRERWRTARRLSVSFEELFTGPAAPWPLERWVEDLTGRIDGPAEDVGAGRWRERLFPAGSGKPPVHPGRERRKYLVRAAGTRWLLKFAGFGRTGKEKLEMSVALAAAGLSPRVAGLRHGFLVTPWLERARPLPLAPIDRRELIEKAAEYVVFRATRFPVAAEARGAAPATLLEWAEAAAREALGADVAERLRAWRERLPDLEALARPVRTDNRMHAWEWLLTRDGRIVKTDAVDHSTDTDPVGAQDPAWDLAGALVELGFEGDEGTRFLDSAARRGLRPIPSQIAFYKVTYLAVQMGRHLAAAREMAADPEEAGRLRRAGEGYGERLRREVAPG